MLENCTQLTSVDFHDCHQITGACCSEERSFSRLRPSALFLEEFSFLGILRELSRVARRTWRNFLLHSKSLLAFLTHTHTRNYYFIGTLPGFVIKLISEGKADFDGCKGPFTLPTDLSSIEDIEKIDLSSLGGRLLGRTIPSGTFFCVWRSIFPVEYSILWSD